MPPAEPDYRGRKVLVTGADGFIGSHLAEALAVRGADITGLSLYNSFDSHGWLDDVPAEVLQSIRRPRGDLRDASFVHRLVQGHEIVFHLAALIAIPYSYVAPQSYVETNILGTLNVLEAARESGVRRVVHTSTSEVYGTAITVPIDESHPLQGQSPYSASKIGADMMAEAFVRSFDLPVAILRPFNTFGPRQSERAVIPTIIRQMLDPGCEAVRIGATAPSRDFTFVSDTVAAFLAMGVSPEIKLGQPYNAGSGKGVSVSEIIDCLASITGRTKPIVHEAERLRPDCSEVMVLLADSTRLTAETGWTPRVALHEGLSRTVSWWRARLGAGRVRRDISFMT